MALTIEIAPDLEPMVREQVSSGRYRDASEVVDDALRWMQHHAAVERLRAELAKGLEDVKQGRGTEYTPDFMERVKQRAEENARLGKPIKPEVLP